MYRASKMNSGIYAVYISDVVLDIENIEELISNGEAVIIADSLDEIADLFNIDTDEIITS